MDALIWVASGIVVGWAAGLLMKGRDYGLGGNLILGAIGGLVGGWLMHLLGFAPPNDIFRQAIVSLLGAMLVLAAARRLKPVARQTRRVLGDTSVVTDLESHIKRLSDFERDWIAKLLRRDAKARDPNAMFEEQMTFGQRGADRGATFGGSWTFIGIFLLMMLIWMIINTETKSHWDPYPFILLNLVLPCLAPLQAPVIMMRQNRQ